MHTVADLCEDGREAWDSTRCRAQSAAAMAALAGQTATELRVRAKLAALAGAHCLKFWKGACLSVVILRQNLVMC